MSEIIPLFPLHTVLFPGGPLRLRIFEARYVDMVGRCMRENSPFGVALIVEGREVGPAKTVTIGTTARIVDFDRLSNGLLGIVARGERRFRIESVEVQPDGLNVAEVTMLAPEAPTPVPLELQNLAELMRQIFPQVTTLYEDVLPRVDDASWLSARLAELLPFNLATRQRCLEIDDPVERLQYLNTLIGGAAQARS
ncbi:MAG: LON peptidase substrate-binding domain-containing protein [Gammaproteobacteria bacterium]|nr:peptidase S16 [Gammaproteobacteria bacterium]